MTTVVVRGERLFLFPGELAMSINKRSWKWLHRPLAPGAIVCALLLFCAGTLSVGCRQSQRSAAEIDSKEPTPSRESVTRVPPVFSDELGEL